MGGQAQLILGMKECLSFLLKQVIRTPTLQVIGQFWWTPPWVRPVIENERASRWCLAGQENYGPKSGIGDRAEYAPRAVRETCKVNRERFDEMGGFGKVSFKNTLMDVWSPASVRCISICFYNKKVEFGLIFSKHTLFLLYFL